MTEPITTAVTTTVVLGSAAYPSPLYVALGGSVEPGGNTGANAIVSSYTGVELKNTGILHGGGGAKDGSIAGGDGVDITGSAKVYNYNSIAGGQGYAGGTGGAGVALHGGALYADGGFGITGGFSTGTGGVGGVGIALYGNTTAATIEGSLTGGAGDAGASGGVGIELVDGSVTNEGTVRGGYTALGGAGHGGTGALVTTGTLTNDGGSIAGGSAYKNGGTGNGGAGVILNGGTLENSSSGITGAITGGTGYGNGGDGVDFHAGGVLTNGGLIGGGGSSGTHSAGSGGIGVDVASGLTVINNDEIEGGYSKSGNGGAAVYLGNLANLKNYAEIFGGAARGSGTGGVAVSVHGGTLANDGFIAGGTAGTGGTYPVGVFLDGGTFNNDGVVEGLNGADAVQFGSAPGTLVLDAGSSLFGDIGSFKAGDTIDVTQVTYAGASYSFDPTTDVLTVTNGNASVSLNLDSSVSGDTFKLSDDGHGDVDVKIACYLSGTRIRSERGDLPVDALRIGDRVATLTGEMRPIRWIGRRRYPAEFAAHDPDVQPILIRAHALAQGVPCRDLRVSPEHAMWIDGMLIPALALVNGISIVRDPTPRELRYFHLEFDGHAVIYAEGAPAESFVDDHSRQMFDNAAEYARSYPDAERVPARFCAPRVEEGWALERVRQRLDARNGVAAIRPLGAAVRRADLFA